MPKDPPEDASLRVWARVLPIRLAMGAPQPAPGVTQCLPDHATNGRFGG